VFLEALQTWTSEHRAELEDAGVEVRLAEPSKTRKPSQWLTLRGRRREAEIGLWVSGECETGIGTPDGSAVFELVHHELTSASEVRRVLQDLAAQVMS
jgi:hypothetical protein